MRLIFTPPTEDALFWHQNLIKDWMFYLGLPTGRKLRITYNEMYKFYDITVEYPKDREADYLRDLEVYKKLDCIKDDKFLIDMLSFGTNNLECWIRIWIKAVKES